MIVFTAVTAAAAWASWWTSHGQLVAMNKQLSEMQGSSTQTDRLIELQAQMNGAAGFQGAMTQKLADNAQSQAANTKKLAQISGSALKAASAQSNATVAETKELLAEQRPWLAINGVGTVTEPLQVWNGQASLWMTLSVNAYGPRPAYHISAHGELLAQNGFWPQDRQKQLCTGSDPPPKGARRFDTVLFPNYTANIPVSVMMNRDDLARLRKVGSTRFGGTIVGCLLYFEQNGRVHHTGFAYDIYQKTPARPGGLDAIDLADAPIRADQLELRPTMMGSGPAD